ncbi:hypothetical protein C2W64_02404 [Brevibacillus laterosporus]|nr:S-layer homology domain-containing protein [Brevibacillus laterosporus]RAP25692.1 hypothetical protein C2W64_02404 [Brevibacillus laterosporus]
MKNANLLSCRKWIVATSGCVLAAGVLVAPFQISGTATIVYAAEKVSAGEMLSQKEAEARAKQWITIPAEYKLDDSQLQKADEWRNSTSWIFSWEAADKKKRSSLDVTIDAKTGELTSFNKYGRDSKTSTKKISQKEAEQIAEAFVEKVAKDKKAFLSKANEIIPVTSEGDLTFIYTRMVDNIPFIENGVTIKVDRKGEIVSYQLDWDSGKIPSSKATISLEEAEKKLYSLLDPQLQYTELDRYTARKKDQGTFTPVYQYGNSSARFLDANSGEALSMTGRKAEDKKKIVPLGDKKSFDNESPQKIDKSDAEKIAKEWSKKLTDGWIYTGQRGSSSSSDGSGIQSQSWSFTFSPPNQTDPAITIHINDYGQIVAYDQQEERKKQNKSEQKAITKQEAEKTANEFIEKVYAQHTGQIYLINESNYYEEPLDYTFTYKFSYNDIPIDQSRIEVEVNKYTNQIESGWLGRGQKSFSWKNEDAFETYKISKEEAVELETKQKKLLLTYYKAPYFTAIEGLEEKDIKELEIPIQLVYRYVGADKNINAVTGELVSSYGLEEETPSDIEGHPSEEALLEAIEQGLLRVEDGKIEPDKEVTRAEFIVWMLQLSASLDHRSHRLDEVKPESFSDVPSTHRDYAAISQASKINLIPKTNRFEPDRAITRMEAMDFFMRMLKLEALLSNKEIYQSPYPDLKTEQVPAFALAYSMGYIKTPKGTNVEPTKTITRAEAAEMIYQFFTLNKGGR